MFSPLQSFSCVCSSIPLLSLTYDFDSADKCCYQQKYPYYKWEPSFNLNRLKQVSKYFANSVHFRSSLFLTSSFLAATHNAIISIPMQPPINSPNINKNIKYPSLLPKIMPVPCPRLCYSGSGSSPLGCLLLPFLFFSQLVSISPPPLVDFTVRMASDVPNITFFARTMLGCHRPHLPHTTEHLYRL